MHELEKVERCCDLEQRNKKEKKKGKKEMREIYVYNLSKYRLFPLSPRVFRFLDAYNSLHFSYNTSMHLCITFMFRFSLSYFVLFSYSLQWVNWMSIMRLKCNQISNILWRCWGKFERNCNLVKLISIISIEILNNEIVEFDWILLNIDLQNFLLLLK